MFKNMNTINNRIIMLIQIIILFFVALNGVFHSVSVANTVSIFLYQFFAWYIIGLSCIKLVRVSDADVIETTALAYAIGITVSIATYMISMLCGIKNLILLVTIVECIVALAILHMRCDEEEIIQPKNIIWLSCLGILFVFFAIATIAVSFVNTLPNETGGSGYYVDWPYWAGDNISFVKSFPAMNYRQVGSIYRYHYFSSIIIAEISLCTGVDVNLVTFYFSYIFGGIILVLSAYFFLKRMKKDEWIPISMIIILFTDGTVSFYSWHTMICPFGFDYALAYSMLSIALLVDILRNNEKKYSYCMSCIFIALATGCKAPVAAITLTAFGMATFCFFCQKKMKMALFRGVGWFLSFVGVYFAFIHSSKSVSYENGGLAYVGNSLTGMVRANMWTSRIYDAINMNYRIESEHFIVKLYSLWLYLYRTNRVVLSLLIIAIIACVVMISCRKIDVIIICLTVPAIVGSIMGIVMAQSGGSQVYFILAMFPLSVFTGMYVLDKFGKLNNHRNLYWGTILVIIATMGVSVCDYYEMIMPKVREGISIIRGKYTAEDYGQSFADDIDYEAFLWLRENTDEDVIVALDDIWQADGSALLNIVGVLCERYIWNEEYYTRNEVEQSRRSAVVEGLGQDAEYSIETMKNEGVSYILSSVRNNKQELGEKTTSVKEVFRNEHYIIYEL